MAIVTRKAAEITEEDEPYHICHLDTENWFKEGLSAKEAREFLEASEPDSFMAVSASAFNVFPIALSD